VLAEVLNRAAVEFPERVAYVADAGWGATFRQLDQFSDECAVWLSTHAGVREGDVVSLVMPSTIDYIVLFGALAKLGAITAGVNSLLTARERAAALECAGPSVILADPALLEGLPGSARVLEVVSADNADDMVRSMRIRNEAPPVLPPDPQRGFTICFTSGSTGTPKGALFRDTQIRAIAQSDTGGSGAWGQGTHSIASTQFAHVGGMTKIPWMLASGGTIHTMDRWRAQRVMQLIHEYRMPALNGGPTQIALMLRQPDFDRYDFSSVKAIISGTGPSSPALIIEARERFHAPYSVRYSSTESGGVGTLTALDAPDEEALYTIGRPRPGVEAMIADDDLRELPVGEIGEMCLRSPCTMAEYWHNPEETAKALVGDGWLRTGDLGLKDDAGCFRLAGRKKEMFIRGGYNVYPLEVEKVLSTHPKVSEIAIVPRADEVMTEIGVAVVVPVDPTDPPTLEELRAHGAKGLARYKLPERIRIIDEMPLNATHKLDRRTLAELDRSSADP
jgi:acyl-CoA synthetase (AMP-forming)/AMP-acid ligase II